MPVGDCGAGHQQAGEQWRVPGALAERGFQACGRFGFWYLAWRDRLRDTHVSRQPAAGCMHAGNPPVHKLRLWCQGLGAARQAWMLPAWHAVCRPQGAGQPGRLQVWLLHECISVHAQAACPSASQAEVQACQPSHRHAVHIRYTGQVLGPERSASGMNSLATAQVQPALAQDTCGRA